LEKGNKGFNNQLIVLPLIFLFFLTRKWAAKGAYPVHRGYCLTDCFCVFLPDNNLRKVIIPFIKIVKLNYCRR